jgi:cytochrome bd-type quinol oxidase subunit 2
VSQKGVAAATPISQDTAPPPAKPGRKVARFREWLRAEARDEWRFSPGFAEVLFLLPPVGAVVVAATRVDKGLFHFVTAEDRLLEWGQFAAYAVAVVFGLAAALFLFRAERRPAAAFYLLVVLGCLFVAGEEISWGQRIFELDTPDPLEDINRQEEITVHNVTSIEGLFRLGELLVGLAASVGVWVLLWKRSGNLSERERVFVPPLFLTTAFFAIFIFRLFRFVVYSGQKHTIIEYTEWPEFCLALGLAAMTLLVWRRLRRDREVDADAASVRR